MYSEVIIHILLIKKDCKMDRLNRQYFSTEQRPTIKMGERALNAQLLRDAFDDFKYLAENDHLREDLKYKERFIHAEESVGWVSSNASKSYRMVRGVKTYGLTFKEVCTNLDCSHQSMRRLFKKEALKILKSKRQKE